MLKIAHSGMKGRKKDTLLMISVILLSMIFIVAAILLHTSNEATKLESKIKTYGKWENALFGVLPTEKETLLNSEAIDRYAITTLIGESPVLGHVGSYNTALDDLGQFQLIEGKMPENDDEIALEYNQMMYSSKDIKVGDRITVQMIVPITTVDRKTATDIQVTNFFDSLGITVETSKIWFAEDQEVLDYINEQEKLGTRDIDILTLIYHKDISSNERNELSYDVIDDIKVELKTSYLYYYDCRAQMDQTDQVKETIKNGTITNEEIILTKEMVVTGIIETYTTTWDLDKSPMPNSFITEHMANRFQNVYAQNGLKETVDHPLKSNILLTSNKEPHIFLAQNIDAHPTLSVNAYSYPNNQYSPDATMTYGILALIFIGSAASAFQINLTQMRRRSRKLTLLKSIGATNGQIFSLLICEFCIYLLIAVPLGIAFGFGITFGAIEILKVTRDIHLNFAMDGALLMYGVAFGIISILIGMIFPLFRALKTPLTGTMSLPPKRKIMKHKLPSSELYMRGLKLQTYYRVSVAHAIYEKRKHLMTLGLYTLVITTLLSSIFLAFTAFEPYINKKIATNKPDFGFEVNYGLTKKEILSLKDELNAISDVKNTRIYKYGHRVFLYQPGLKESDFFTDQQNEMDPETLFKRFANEDDVFDNLSPEQLHLVSDALKVSIYGIDVDDPIYESFVNSENTFDTAKFMAGESVIMLMPVYDPTNAYETSYDFRDARLNDSNPLFNVGDKIQLSIKTETLEGDKRTNKLAFHEVDVAGVIRTFDPNGQWPFSSTLENPVIITSYDAMNRFFPASATRMSIEPEFLEILLETIYPTRFARTSIYVYADDQANMNTLQLSLQRLGIQYGLKLDNYNLENEILLGKSLKTALNIIVLGMAIAIITLLILYNTSLSKLEQERERIGTLQALGVTKRQFRLFYIGTGTLYAFVSLAMAHVANLIILLITGLFDGHFNLVHQLWLYPWPIHTAVSIIFAVIAILTYYLPLEKILKKQPINNIQNLQD